MKFTRDIMPALSAVLLFASSGMAATTGAGNGTSTIQHCYTAKANTSTNSVPRSTTMRTTTITMKETSTVTPVRTATSSRKTSTVTVTRSTTASAAPASVATYTTTRSISVTSTVTARASTTTLTRTTRTTISTLSSGTTTVATKSGFKPALSSLPNSAEKRKRDLDIRQAAARRAAAAAALAPRAAGTAMPAVAILAATRRTLYPHSVVCSQTIEVFSASVTTVTASTTSTTTVRGATTTKTVTTTATIQGAPPINASSTVTKSTTVSFFTTTTPTTTVRTTVTRTATIVQASATQYAACNSNNIVGTVSGDGIDQVFFVTPASLANTDDTTSYDCCVSCITNSECAASSFFAGFATGNQCANYITPSNATCSSQGQYDYQVHRDTTGSLGPDDGYLVSNGNCGFYDVVTN